MVAIGEAGGSDGVGTAGYVGPFTTRAELEGARERTAPETVIVGPPGVRV